MEHNWPTERPDAPAQCRVHATSFPPRLPFHSSVWVFRYWFSHLEQMTRKPGGAVASPKEAPYVPATPQHEIRRIRGSGQGAKGLVGNGVRRRHGYGSPTRAT